MSQRKQNLRQDNANLRKDNANLRQDNANSWHHNANSQQHNANSRQNNANFFTAEVKCHGGCKLITIPLQAIEYFCKLWRNLWKLTWKMSTWSCQKTTKSSSAVISSGASPYFRREKLASSCRELALCCRDLALSSRDT